MEPCPECGNKPFGGKIKHKKDCKKNRAEELAKQVWEPNYCDFPPEPDHLHNTLKSGAEELSKKVDKEMLADLETINGHICCGEPMHRTDGAPYEVMCQHSRLLSGECAECRKQHHGILIYHCKLCGRNLQDSPQLAQGADANAALWTIKR